MLFFIKKSKILILLFLLITFLYIFQVNISQAVEDSSNSIRKYISVENFIKGNRFKVGEEFKITYMIDGDDIPKDVIIGEENSKKKEIVLVIDTSGSMGYDIYGNEVYGNKKTRLGIVKSAVKNFIDKLTKNSKKFIGSDNISIALVSYSDYAIAEEYPSGFSKNYDNEYFATLTEIKDYNKLNNSFINSLHADGGTNIGDGLRKAYYLLKEYGNDDAEQYIVLMTDGEPTSFGFNSIDSENSYNLIGIIKEKNKKVNSEHNYRGNINSVDYFIENELDPKNYGYFSSNANYQIDYKEFGLTYSSKIASMIANDGVNIHTFIIGFSNGINEDKLSTINEDIGGSYWEAETEDALNDVYEKIAEHISASIVLDDVIFNQKLPQGIEVINSNNNYVNENTIEKEIDDIIYKYNLNNGKYEIESLNFEIKYKGISPGDFTLEDSSISFTDINGEEINLEFQPISISLYEYKAPISVLKSTEKDKYFLNEEFVVNYTIDPGIMPSEFVENDDENVKKEIVLLFDTSGSMNEDINGEETGNNKKRLAIAKDAANVFIDKLVYDENGSFKGDKNIDIFLVSYDNYGEYLARESLYNLNDVKKIKREINRLGAEGGTNIGDGLRKAYYTLKNYGINDAEKYIILLTDGEPTSYSSKYWWHKQFYFGDGDNYYYIGGYERDQEDVDYAKAVADRLISNDGFFIKTFMVGFTDDANMDDLEDIASKCNGYCKTAKDESALNSIYKELAVQIQNDLFVQDIYFEEFFSEGIEIIDSSDILEISDRKMSGNIDSIVYTYNEESKEYKAKPISFWAKLKIAKAGDYWISKDDEGNNSSSLKYTDLGLNDEIKHFPVLSLNIIDNEPNVEIIKHGIFINSNSENSMQNYLYRPSDNIVNITNGYNIKMGVIFKCNSIDINKYEMSIVLNNSSANNVTAKIKDIFSYGIDDNNSLHVVNNVENLRVNGNGYIFDYRNDKNYNYYMIVYEYFVEADDTVDYTSLTLSNDVILYDAMDSIDIKIVELPSID